MQLPRELLEAVDEVLQSKEPDVSLRVTVALECWLHGSVTTEQAIGVLRTRARSKR
jgi:hypothetical protein